MTYFSMPLGIVGDFVLHCYYWLQCLRMSKDENLKNSASICYKFASFVRCLQDVRIICNGIYKHSEHSLGIFKN